jgi:hypothetical protein
MQPGGADVGCHRRRALGFRAAAFRERFETLRPCCNVLGSARRTCLSMAPAWDGQLSSRSMETSSASLMPRKGRGGNIEGQS